MNNKIHQTSSTEYQIRIDGEPVRNSPILTKDEFDIYLDLFKANADKYVDIVVVHTEILINQFNYSQMKKHFEGYKTVECTFTGGNDPCPSCPKKITALYRCKLLQDENLQLMPNTELTSPHDTELK